jgi:Putative transposase
MIFEPLDLVARLAALVPPPRFNVVRYHGILAPAAALRPMVVPESGSPDVPPCHECAAKSRNSPCDTVSANEKRKVRPRNYRWAELMRRVFDVDVLMCDRAAGR